MTYYQAIRLKRYLLDNYGSEKCSVRVHHLTQCEISDYECRGAKIYGVNAIRIHVHIDDSVAEYTRINKDTTKSMRSLMLDCKNDLY